MNWLLKFFAMRVHEERTLPEGWLIDVAAAAIGVTALIVFLSTEP